MNHLKLIRLIVVINLLFIILCGCFGENGSNNNSYYKKGSIKVRFIEGINDTRANDIIGKYNLTILGGGIDKNGFVGFFDVDVPNGQEKYYKELLEKEPEIDYVELYWKK